MNFHEATTTADKIFSKNDYWNCWKLKTDEGRQTWHFEPPAETEVSEDFLADMSEAFRFDATKNPNSRDKVYRAQQNKKFQSLEEQQELIQNIGNHSFVSEVFYVTLKGWNYYKTLQAAEGHFPGDYGGPQFLLPGLIITAYVTETSFPQPHQELMKRYMLNHQNADGGWGLHIEGKSTMFGTVMQYVSLRILGLRSDATELQKAREWIMSNGSATAIPPWGKFYLAVLGVFDWDGCNSLFPELWLLPKWLPVHPSRYWCHSRMVYLPMAYCYGNRVTGKITPLVKELRKELFAVSHEFVNWERARDEVAGTDRYAKDTGWLKLLNRFTNFYEKRHSTRIRKKALNFVLKYIHAEDEQTDYINIGPVNQVLNSICVWHACGKNSVQFSKHMVRWQDYLWVAEDGMKMNGYNGSQLWDTAFAMQAMLEGGMEKHFSETLLKAYSYVEISQVREEVPQREKFFRHISKGGFPFSTLAHGWPISDCTAEAVSAILKSHQAAAIYHDKTTPVSSQRIFDAINVLLSFQNKNGGWATYENTRSPAWIEKLNPAAIFDRIMLDYSWTECSSACIRALCEFHREFPKHRPDEIKQAVKKGVTFIKSQQRDDGSWLGSWAVCFTYGTWFGIEALVAARTFGLNNEAAIKRACRFLLSKQNENGGWGESFESCVQKKYIPHENSQVVNTSWALLALMAADCSDKKSIEQGVQFLMHRQHPNGDWKQENISGVFNANCMITYTAYRNVFPLWALGRYLKSEK